ncbi:MAG TPA: hypothetical protein VKG38_10060 [Solirubrobacteraceae bacterium]|nr:hypothetical protein [Solirubrobacteraceae bacterium]
MRAVNLIPAEQRSGAPVGAGRSGGVAYAVLALLAGIAVLALVYGIAHHQVTSRTSQVASLQARASAEQASAAQLAPYTSFVAMRQARVTAVEQLVDSRFDWAHTLHEFARVLPRDASLSSVSGTIGSAAGTSPGASPSAGASSSATAGAGSSASVSSVTPPGSVPTFAVTGCASTQDAVAETIDRLRLINGVSSVALTNSTKPGSGVTSSTPGTGGCGANAPTFTLSVAFQPLPATSAAAAAATTRTVAAHSSSAAAAAGPSASAAAGPAAGALR